jgi:hypothetical protein
MSLSFKSICGAAEEGEEVEALEVEEHIFLDISM